MNKKRILWLSRHSPTLDQQKSLEKFLGESLDIIQVSTTIKNAYEVRRIMEQEHCEDLVVILPWSTIGQLCSINLFPIRPVSSKKNEYNSFMRTEKVEIIQHPLGSL